MSRLDDKISGIGTPALTGEFLIAVQKAVIEAVNKFMFLPVAYNPGKKSGGYFGLFDALTGLPLIPVPVGEFSVVKGEKYFSLIIQKAAWVFADSKYCSCLQNPSNKDHLLGGIRAGKYILSFSGLTDEGDEAVCLYVANKLALLHPGQIFTITNQSKNLVYQELFYQELPRS